MRVPLVAGNWKMNTNVSEATDLVRAMLAELDGITGVEKVLCPPFVSLTAIKELVQDTSIQLGAQNMYFEHKGAYTGEISSRMLVGLCNFVIIGHSERRQYFTETDEIINSKVKAALISGLRPILCVGESLEHRETGRTETVIAGQVHAALAEVTSTDQLVIAYEPIWAIGTGMAATGEQVNASISIIRGTVASLWGNDTSEAIRILYGGSVTLDNIAEFIGKPDIDGALVGGASLNTDQFLSIVSQTAAIKSR